MPRFLHARQRAGFVCLGIGLGVVAGGLVGVTVWAVWAVLGEPPFPGPIAVAAFSGGVLGGAWFATL